MEIYILDSLIRPIDVVDEFESMVWAERRSRMGDFQLVTLSTVSNRKKFAAGTWIMITESLRVMEIMTIEEKVDDDGVRILDIKGLEITHILKARLALKGIAPPGSGVEPVWIIPPLTAPHVMRHIFAEICQAGRVSEDDIIPFIFDGNLYPGDTIDEPTDLIDWEQKPDTVLAALEELADIYDMGFRLYKDPNLSKLYFNVYAGSDRTSAQTEVPAVIFSHDLENLENTTDFVDLSEAYNVVRVMYTHTLPGPPEVEETLTFEVYDGIEIPEGFNRRVKLLVVSNVPEEITDLEEFLLQAGWDELMKNRPVTAFDGEISPNSQLKYERDYYMGDLVELRSSTGGTAYMRVEEYIFIQDKSGERSYPTLAAKEYKTPGTWDSWMYDVEWDLFPEETWDEQ